MRILAYTYEAAVHCIACTQARKFTCDGEGLDRNNVPYGAKDREGNFVYPVMSYNEGQLDEDGNIIPDVCNTCRELIDA